MLYTQRTCSDENENENMHDGEAWCATTDDFEYYEAPEETFSACVPCPTGCARPTTFAPLREAVGVALTAAATTVRHPTKIRWDASVGAGAGGGVTPDDVLVLVSCAILLDGGGGTNVGNNKTTTCAEVALATLCPGTATPYERAQMIFERTIPAEIADETFWWRVGGGQEPGGGATMGELEVGIDHAGNYTLVYFDAQGLPQHAIEFEVEDEMYIEVRGGHPFDRIWVE